ncbi:MAG: LexA family transcriptional regulator [Saprospiraceae bacterium]|nr:LexA family transcriptional regulator [Saprospiraceae bacterium]
MRKKRNKSQVQMAERIGINRSTYADYEKGKTEPPASIILRIADFFSIAVDDLLKSDIGAPLFQNKIMQLPSVFLDGLRVVTVSVDKNGRENIEFVPIQAVAGYSTSFGNPDFIQELPRLHLPNLPQGTYRAFEIAGDSMPPIHEGYIVVGRFVEHWQNLKNGKRYILVLQNDGIVFKRVVNEVSQHRKLVLYSDNSEYLPLTVSITDVLEAWELVAFVGFPKEHVQIEEVILEKLQYIEQKINLLTIRDL